MNITRFAIMIMVVALCLPPANIRTENESHETKSTDVRYLTGGYWDVLKERAPKGSLNMYSTGFINGYNYSLILLKNVLKNNKNNPDVIHSFSDMMMFPENIKPTELIKIINDFYQLDENKLLPIFVAFTYARQKLSHYPDEFINEYLSETRKTYLK